MDGIEGAAAPVAASEELRARPNCLAIGACKAVTPGKHCRSCTMKAMNRDPAQNAARVASLRIRCSSPEYRAKLSQARKAAEAVLMQDPAYVEKKRLQGHLTGKQNFLLGQATGARQKAGKAIRAKLLAWCPEEYWPLNAKLKADGYRLPERKALIAADIKHNSPAAAARRQIRQFEAEQHARAAREKAQAY